MRTRSCMAKCGVDAPHQGADVLEGHLVAGSLKLWILRLAHRGPKLNGRRTRRGYCPAEPEPPSPVNSRRPCSIASRSASR